MEDIDNALRATVSSLSDENYAQSLAFYRFWFDIGQTYHQIPPDKICDDIWNNRWINSSINPEEGKIIHTTAHLILRFASDAESDPLFSPHNPGLQSRLCARTLREFFSRNLRFSHGDKPMGNICADANLIAHWVNLGYVEEVAIRNHILQSLISHPKLYDHQADALIILFKLAGAAFEAYADPSMVDRCFELLKDHSYYNRSRVRYESNPAYYGQAELDRSNSYDMMKRERVQVCEPLQVKGCCHRAKTNLQEVVALRERGWEGLPPPPVFTTRKPKPTVANQNDPTSTPVATLLGLPNRDLEPQIPQSPPLGSTTVRESDPIPVSPITPVARSPSISIASLSDFTIADTTDDESSVDPMSPGTSDDELPIDLATPTPHKTFYLEDGNAEVLCGNTLFRVHTTILSFHSPALRRMFAQTSLATAESPNGCPRILSSDTPKDFATLLKMIYLPGYVALPAPLGYSTDYLSIYRFPERNKVPDFATFSSLLRITAKYEMPTVRSQLLDAVRDAYPGTFEGLAPSKPLGESVFSGPTPHPNEVLNLFVQQNITSALPMAYYMAARRGLDSLMDEHLPQNAVLSPRVLRSAISGLMALREVELNGAHHLIFGPKGTHHCSTPNCPSRTPTGSAALEAYQKVFDRIAGSSQQGTKVLQVPEFIEDLGDDVQGVGPGICSSCVERWASGHAELRKKAWATLPDVFGLRSRIRIGGSVSGSVV